MEKIRKQADIIIKVSEMKNLGRIIAEKKIKYDGYYTFINEKGQKVFVEK